MLAMKRHQQTTSTSKRRQTAAVLFVDRELDLTQLCGSFGEHLLDQLVATSSSSTTTTNQLHRKLNDFRLAPLAAEPDDDDVQFTQSLFCDAPLALRRALLCAAGGDEDEPRDVIQHALLDFVSSNLKVDGASVAGTLNVAKLRKIRQAIADDTTTRASHKAREADLCAAALMQTIQPAERNRIRAGILCLRPFINTFYFLLIL